MPHPNRNTPALYLNALLYAVLTFIAVLSFLALVATTESDSKVWIKYIIIEGILLALAVTYSVYVAIVSRRTNQLLQSNTTSLTEYRGQLNAILEMAPDGILSVDSHGVILSANATITEIFGYTQAELIGHSVEILIPQAHHHKHAGYIAQYAQTGSAKKMAAGREVTGIHKNGTEIPLEIGLCRTVMPDESVRIIAAITDISARTAIENEREQLIAKLTQSNSELERFAYIASHDMQEPVRMVIHFSQILAEDYEHILDTAGKIYLKQLVDSSTRMQLIIQGLLNYSKMEEESAKWSVFDANVMLNSTLDTISEFVKEHNARITHDLLPNLYGNPVQFMRLLQNLITNGIKYQPKQNTPHIHVGVERLRSQYCISVKDNGEGIPATFIDEIFQPFRRLHTWEETQGSGLGLSICKKIVESHGGKMWVESEEGNGSIFYFTFPYPEEKANAI